MKQAIETGKDKVKKICEVLRKETLEPAMEEAGKLVDEAQAKADQILKNAKEKSAKMVESAEKDIEKKRGIFQASLTQGARQSVEWLRQEIDERLINPNLSKLIEKASSGPEILGDMIQAIVKAIGEEGLETELSAIIPSAVDPKAVNEVLGKEIALKLKEGGVILGPMKGGIEVKLHGSNITIDLTDEALLDLMTRYVRKDFHKYFFEN